MGKWETLTEKDPQGNLCSEANVLYLDVVLVKREYECQNSSNYVLLKSTFYKIMPQ